MISGVTQTNDIDFQRVTEDATHPRSQQLLYIFFYRQPSQLRTHLFYVFSEPTRDVWCGQPQWIHISKPQIVLNARKANILNYWKQKAPNYVFQVVSEWAVIASRQMRICSAISWRDRLTFTEMVTASQQTKTLSWIVKVLLTKLRIRDQTCRTTCTHLPDEPTSLTPCSENTTVTVFGLT